MLYAYRDEPVRAITGLITASNAIYRDSENLYREAIAQKPAANFLSRHLRQGSTLLYGRANQGSNRKEECSKSS